MRARLTVAALVAGCYSPSYGPGTTCDTTCPGDLVCVDRVCREPGYVPPIDAALDGPPDAPPVDTDGDSHFDHEDNCPAEENSDQHDEDGDGVGDVCDPCPHLAVATPDTDGDKVGDACDPEPSVAKQSIVFFDAFTSDRAEWVLESEWGRQGGQLRFDGTQGTARLFLPTGELRIIVGGTVQSVGATLPRSLSTSFGFADNGADYFYGNLYENGADTSISVTRADSDTYTTVAGPTGPSGSFPTGPFRMQVDESVSSQTLGITAILGGIDYPLQTGAAGTPVLITGDRISFYARNVVFRFDYVVLIQTSP